MVELPPITDLIGNEAFVRPSEHHADESLELPPLDSFNTGPGVLVSASEDRVDVPDSDKWFEHSPLPWHGTIRLLMITLPINNSDRGGTDHEICCSLAQGIALAHAPPYKAISYVWGDNELSHAIRINGRRLMITASAYCVLSKLGQHGESGAIWIDSICIDQRNDIEKNAQVRLMAEIYTQAESVIGTLDALGEGHQKEYLCRAVTAFANGDKEAWEDAKSPIWGEVETLSRLPYWGRLWIPQECILAKELLFLCSGHLFAASKLYEALSHSTDFLGDPATARLSLWRKTLPQTYLWQLLKLRFSSSKQFEFDEAMASFHTKQCSEPRDRIFALSALIKWPQTGAYPIDYTKTLQQIACETARYCQSERGGQALVYALHYTAPLPPKWLMVKTLGRFDYPDRVRTVITDLRANRIDDLVALGGAAMLVHLLETQSVATAHSTLTSVPSHGGLDYIGALLVRPRERQEIYNFVQDMERRGWLDARRKMVLALNAILKLKPSPSEAVIRKLAGLLDSPLPLDSDAILSFQETYLGAPRSKLTFTETYVLADTSMELRDMARVANAFLPGATISELEVVAAEAELYRTPLSDKIDIAHKALSPFWHVEQLIRLLRLLSFDTTPNSWEVVVFIIRSLQVTNISSLEQFYAVLESSSVERHCWADQQLKRQCALHSLGKAIEASLEDLQYSFPCISGIMPQIQRPLRQLPHVFHCRSESFIINAQDHGLVASHDGGSFSILDHTTRQAFRLPVSPSSDAALAHEIRHDSHVVGHVEPLLQPQDFIMRICRRDNIWVVLRRSRFFDGFRLVGPATFSSEFAAKVDRLPEERNLAFEILVDECDFLDEEEKFR